MPVQDRQEQPADRIARLTPGDDEAHHAYRHAEQKLRRICQHVLVGQYVERDHGRGQQHDQHGQHIRRRRGCQPKVPFRAWLLLSRLAGCACPHPSHATPGAFRERYRSVPHMRTRTPPNPGRLASSGRDRPRRPAVRSALPHRSAVHRLADRAPARARLGPGGPGGPPPSVSGPVILAIPRAEQRPSWPP